jgi:heme O synthase-like polyprenyltransferase
MENIVTEIPETKAISLKEKSAAYLELTKPRIAFMLVLTAAAGFYLGIKENFELILFVWLSEWRRSINISSVKPMF